MQLQAGALALATEYIQNLSAHILLSVTHTASITSMKAPQSLPNISFCRRISCLCFFCKISRSTPTLCQALFSQPSYTWLSTNCILKERIPHCGTCTFNASILPQTSIDWNCLPAVIVKITNTADFRIAIHNLLNDNEKK
ncbi:unnamed protein product, partial [Ixodes pacificus]